MAQVTKKLRPGYTFHNEVTGIALQRSLPDADGNTTVVAINKDGGREACPGPFFLIDEEMAKKQAIKFEDPTEKEVELLKKANSKELDIKIAPPQSPMKTIAIDDKALKATPADKEVKDKVSTPPAPPAAPKAPEPEPKSDAMSLRDRFTKKKKKK